MAKKAVIGMGLVAATFINGMGPGIVILTKPVSTEKAIAIITAVITIARDTGSNRNFTGVIITRRTVTRLNSTGAILTARPTGINPNFGPGVTDRFTGVMNAGLNSIDRTMEYL